MEISGLRKEYSNLTLRRKDLYLNPFDQFKTWFTETVESHILEPTAMQLTTCLGDRPSIRTVLLKKIDEHGFTFFSHYTSRKGKELEANPHAAALFLWKELERQVVIEGVVEKIPQEETEKYFSSRPRTSQLGALASPQSTVIASREVLEEKYTELRELYEGKKIPFPPMWGGFKLLPNRFEFWQGRPFRLHDRFQYVLKNGTWSIDRLAP
jgi:pyridoxamine 5'-phosphate oxidase